MSAATAAAAVNTAKKRWIRCVHIPTKEKTERQKIIGFFILMPFCFCRRSKTKSVSNSDAASVASSTSSKKSAPAGTSSRAAAAAAAAAASATIGAAGGAALAGGEKQKKKRKKKSALI